MRLKDYILAVGAHPMAISQVGKPTLSENRVISFRREMSVGVPGGDCLCSPQTNLCHNNIAAGRKVGGTSSMPGEVKTLPVFTLNKIVCPKAPFHDLFKGFRVATTLDRIAIIQSRDHVGIVRCRHNIVKSCHHAERQSNASDVTHVNTTIRKTSQKTVLNFVEKQTVNIFLRCGDGQP